MGLTGEIQKVEKGPAKKRVKVKIKGRLHEVSKWDEFVSKLKALGTKYGFRITTSPRAKKSKKKKAAGSKKK